MADVVSVLPPPIPPTLAEGDRVRENTAADINFEIDRRTERTIRLYSTQPTWLISERLEELDREWDIERVLHTNASSLALAGVVLGTLSSRKWFVLTAGVAGFLFLHGTQGWCPPIPALRKLGVRTATEIAREKFALKYLRGDFGDIPDNERKQAADRVIAGLRI